MVQNINIVLRPVNSGKDCWRLGLYTKEFKQYVLGRDIRALYIDLCGGLQHVDALKTYFHGSITNPIVNEWLHRNGWMETKHQLLFKLEMESVMHSHKYHFVKQL